MNIEQLAAEVLATLELQKKFFAARKANLPEATTYLSAAKSKEAALKKTCEGILEKKQPDLFNQASS